MYEAKTNSSAMVETTDCLETVGVFRSAKNFFFTFAIISLVATQAIFWLGRFEVINWGDKPPVNTITKDGAHLATKITKDAQSEKIDSNQMKINTKEPQEMESIAEDAKEAIATVNDGASTSIVEDVQENDSGVASNKLLHRVDWSYLKVLINVANAVVVFSIVCYVLILVFSLKVSLVGKLGGLSHISSAFLISLFASLVILPWQLAFPGIHLFGAIFTTQELHKWLSNFSDAGMIARAMCYVRFVFTFLLAVWLLVWAQLRSRKWARATLKRLGIVP